MLMVITAAKSGRRQAFYIDETMRTEHGFIPSIVTEDTPGHTPLSGSGPQSSPWFWGHDLASARRIAATANARLGLSDSDVRDIVASSFRASEAIAEAGQVIRSMAAGAVSYDVARGDEPDDGWFLRRVTLADGAVIDQDDPSLAIIERTVALYLSQIAWGAWGGRDAVSVLRIDARTGRWLREP
ncbi:hypothetical protein ACGFJ7_35285 [Actinoplanes sp. NPDC048988]|uniref:hypothetical protein n=1 Tax=Actinoplanes sp. NPDC048988 TaxID=3363901 RepID=UPI00370F90B8